MLPSSHARYVDLVAVDPSPALRLAVVVPPQDDPAPLARASTARCSPTESSPLVVAPQPRRRRVEHSRGLTARGLPDRLSEPVGGPMTDPVQSDPRRSHVPASTTCISPELALVDPLLAAAARELLPERVETPRTAAARRVPVHPSQVDGPIPACWREPASNSESNDTARPSAMGSSRSRGRGHRRRPAPARRARGGRADTGVRRRPVDPVRSCLDAESEAAHARHEHAAFERANPQSRRSTAVRVGSDERGVCIPGRAFPRRHACLRGRHPRSADHGPRAVDVPRQAPFARAGRVPLARVAGRIRQTRRPGDGAVLPDDLRRLIARPSAVRLVPPVRVESLARGNCTPWLSQTFLDR